MQILIFFFQAEDGIRDVAVTGVQTCALPISIRAASSTSSRVACGRANAMFSAIVPSNRKLRSEERRVGKECRSGWSPYPLKQKIKALAPRSASIYPSYVYKQVRSAAWM